MWGGDGLVSIMSKYDDGNKMELPEKARNTKCMLVEERAWGDWLHLESGGSNLHPISNQSCGLMKLLRHSKERNDSLTSIKIGEHLIKFYSACCKPLSLSFLSFCLISFVNFDLLQRI